MWGAGQRTGPPSKHRGRRFETSVPPQPYYPNRARTSTPAVQSHITIPRHRHRKQQQQQQRHGRSKGLAKTWQSHRPNHVWLNPHNGLSKTWQGASRGLTSIASNKKSWHRSDNGYHQPWHEQDQNPGSSKHQTSVRLNGFHSAVEQDRIMVPWRTNTQVQDRYHLWREQDLIFSSLRTPPVQSKQSFQGTSRSRHQRIRRTLDTELLDPWPSESDASCSSNSSRSSSSSSSVLSKTKRNPSRTGSSGTRSDNDYDIAHDNVIDDNDAFSDVQSNNITVITISNECNALSTNFHQPLQSEICTPTPLTERLSKFNINNYDNINRSNSLPDLTLPRALHGERVRYHGTFPQTQKENFLNSASLYRDDTQHVLNCTKSVSTDTAIRLDSSSKLPAEQIIRSDYENGDSNCLTGEQFKTKTSNYHESVSNDRITFLNNRPNNLNGSQEASSSKSQFLGRFPQNLGSLPRLSSSTDLISQDKSVSEDDPTSPWAFTLPHTYSRATGQTGTNCKSVYLVSALLLCGLSSLAALILYIGCMTPAMKNGIPD